MTIEPKNLQLVCKDRRAFFLTNLKVEDLDSMGRADVIFMGNKYGKIGKDKSGEVTISRKNDVTEIALKYIQENLICGI